MMLDVFARRNKCMNVLYTGCLSYYRLRRNILLLLLYSRILILMY